MAANQAIQKELAERKAEAEAGDILAVVDEILNDISEDLSHSKIDNSREIAEADAILGLSTKPNNNGSH